MINPVLLTITTSLRGILTTKRKINRIVNNSHTITLEVDNNVLTDKEGSQERQKSSEQNPETTINVYIKLTR